MTPEPLPIVPVCVYGVFDSQSALELNPEVVTLTPGTSCIYF